MRSAGSSRAGSGASPRRRLGLARGSRHHGTSVAPKGGSPRRPPNGLGNRPNGHFTQAGTRPGVKGRHCWMISRLDRTEVIRGHGSGNGGVGQRESDVEPRRVDARARARWSAHPACRGTAAGRLRPPARGAFRVTRSDHDSGNHAFSQLRGGAGGARTHDRRIMRRPDNAPCGFYLQPRSQSIIPELLHEP